MQGTRARFEPPGDVDLVLDTRDDLDAAVVAVVALATAPARTTPPPPGR